jgi:hypothetical protein
MIISGKTQQMSWNQSTFCQSRAVTVQPAAAAPSFDSHLEQAKTQVGCQDADVSTMMKSWATLRNNRG